MGFSFFLLRGYFCSRQKHVLLWKRVEANIRTLNRKTCTAMPSQEGGNASHALFFFLYVARKTFYIMRRGIDQSRFILLLRIFLITERGKQKMNIDWENMTPELYEELFEEEWRPVKDFLLYNVSNYGRVMNVKSGRILKQSPNQRGYMSLTLNQCGYSFSVRVHKLVGAAFCEVPEGYTMDELDVDHGDGDKTNNHAYNLEWVTRKENARRAFVLGLRRAPRMKKIRVVETGEVYDSIRECARAIGRETDQRSISEYLAGRAKHVKGYRFELV